MKKKSPKAAPPIRPTIGVEHEIQSLLDEARRREGTDKPVPGWGKFWERHFAAALDVIKSNPTDAVAVAFHIGRNVESFWRKQGEWILDPNPMKPNGIGAMVFVGKKYLAGHALAARRKKVVTGKWAAAAASRDPAKSWNENYRSALSAGLVCLDENNNPPGLDAYRKGVQRELNRRKR